MNDFHYYDLNKSGAVEAHYDNNVFEIETSRVIERRSPWLFSINCGDFTDLDELNPISFQIDVDALPVHFKSFKVQKVSDWVYRVTFY